MSANVTDFNRGASKTPRRFSRWVGLHIKSRVSSEGKEGRNMECGCPCPCGLSFGGGEQELSILTCRCLRDDIEEANRFRKCTGTSNFRRYIERRCKLVKSGRNCVVILLKGPSMVRDLRWEGWVIDWRKEAVPISVDLARSLRSWFRRYRGSARSRATHRVTDSEDGSCGAEQTPQACPFSRV